MAHKISLEPAYVLHARVYRETSLLVEFFTREYGRVSAIARGVRSARSPLKGLLQAFVPLYISWSGKTDLMTLTSAEPRENSPCLNGQTLFCALYLNELILHLVHRFDPHQKLFEIYEETLRLLTKHDNARTSKTLRLFEKKLLQELGYATQFDRDLTNRSIESDKFYNFYLGHGFQCTPDSNAFPGKHLLDLHQEAFENEASMRTAKKVLRHALKHLLGEKKIRSRELFLSVDSQIN